VILFYKRWFCFIKGDSGLYNVDSGWGLVYCAVFESGLVSWSDINTQEPHYWSRYSPHTTISRWWAEIRTWSRHYYSQCQGLQPISDSLLQTIRTGSLLAWRAVYYQRQKVPRKGQIQHNKGTVVPLLNKNVYGGRVQLPALTSALDWHEWSASRHGRLTPGKTAPCTNRVGNCVDPRADLDAFEKSNIYYQYWKSNYDSSISSP
jgi:hypothetical protein